MQYIGLEGIEKETGRLLGMADLRSIRSRVQLFDPGDVLYGRMRPYLRKAHVADMPGSASGEIIVLRCSDQILPDYLLTVLLSDHFSRFAEVSARGDRPRTSFSAISKYEMDLPSLRVQEEVATRNRVATESLASILAAQGEVTTYAEDILASVREALIWGSTTAPRAPFGTLVDSIAYGTSEKSSYGVEGRPVLRIPNVGNNGALESSDLKFAPLDDEDAKKHSVDEGDLLFIRSNGSASVVGRAAIVDQHHHGYCFAGYLLRARPSKALSGEFLLQITKSPGFRRLIAEATRSTAGIHNLSAGRLAELEIPNPPLDSQRAIVEKMQVLDAIIASVAANLNSLSDAAKRGLAEARHAWLNQPCESEADLSSKADDPTEVVPERRQKGNTVANPAAARARILDRLGDVKRPSRFDELFTAGGDEYDLLRDALFALLAEKPARVRQEFDTDRGVLLRLEK